jgi:hypothetical protein
MSWTGRSTGSSHPPNAIGGLAQASEDMRLLRAENALVPSPRAHCQPLSDSLTARTMKMSF